MEEVAGATTEICERWMTEAIRETLTFRIRTSREEVTKDRAIRGRIIRGGGGSKIKGKATKAMDTREDISQSRRTPSK
jgi:hypothetical protein